MNQFDIKIARIIKQSLEKDDNEKNMETMARALLVSSLKLRIKIIRQWEKRDKVDLTSKERRYVLENHFNDLISMLYPQLIEEILKEDEHEERKV
jgi:hypothetical protein